MAHLARSGQGFDRLDQGSLAATELTSPARPADVVKMGKYIFKHLLLRTDGSPSSEDAIRKAIAFAKDAQSG